MGLLNLLNRELNEPTRMGLLMGGLNMLSNTNSGMSTGQALSQGLLGYVQGKQGYQDMQSGNEAEELQLEIQRRQLAEYDQEAKQKKALRQMMVGGPGANTMGGGINPAQMGSIDQFKPQRGLLDSLNPQEKQLGLLALESGDMSGLLGLLRKPEQMQIVNHPEYGLIQIDPSNGAINRIAAPAAGPKPPTIQEFTEGDEIVEKQWTPESGWVEISRGPRYRPETNINLGADKFNEPLRPSDASRYIDAQGNPPPPGATMNEVRNGGYTMAGSPLPTAAQDSLSQSMDAFGALDQIEDNIGVSGPIEGRIGKTMAAFGQNQNAIDFMTARDNFKLSAQAMIKGIPSNFDVQTVIDTLPDINNPETVNESRIKYSRDLLKGIVKRTIAFHKGTNAIIPEQILVEAKKNGINVNSITPWNGQGDPLAGVMEEAKGNNGQARNTWQTEAYGTVTMDDIQTTAQKHGMTVNQVKQRLGIQ